MQKIDFNKDWICRCLTRDEEAYPVTLPHDAMLSEPRTQESTGEGNVGWYIGGDYEYTKNFFVPEEYKDKKVLIEFEGIYHNGEVYINGKKAAYRPYGYTNFYVDTEGFFQYGKEMRSKSLRAMLTSQTAVGIQEPVFTVRLICMLGKKNIFR